MKTNRILCLLLTVVMLFTVVFQTGVFAEEPLLEDEYTQEDNEWPEAAAPVDEYLDEEEEDEEEDNNENPAQVNEDEEELINEEDDRSEEMSDKERENDPAGETLQNESSLTASETVAFEIGAPATITKQPENATGSIGDTVTFAVEAENATAYVWQYSKDKGATWTSWTSEQYRQPTIELSLTKSRMTMKYRCQVTGEDGKNIYSDVVGVTAGAAAKITKQPENAHGNVGDTVTFAVEAENATTYVWQYSKDNGATWTSWTSEQYRQPTIELSLTKSRMTMKYRCQVTGTNGKSIYSDAVGVISSIVENDLIYKLNDDNTLTVIGYTGNAAAVVVPKTVEGHTVTAIGESAFEGMTFIQSVKLPETITIIMRRAFADCTSLREMS